MKRKKFSITERIKSFKYAIDGLRVVINDEHNFRIHLFISIGVFMTAYSLNFSMIEWTLLIFSIGLVLFAEVMNTVIERICDIICLESNKEIGLIKDVAAAGVLITSVVAALIGLILFVQKIIYIIKIQ